MNSGLSNTIGEAPEVRCLETLGLSFLLLDGKGKLVFLSSAARRLLRLGQDTDVAEAAPLVAPLIEISANGGDSLLVTREHLLRTAAKTQTAVLAERHYIDCTHDGEFPCRLTCLVLHSLHPLEPFLDQLDRQRRIRPLVVLAAANLALEHDLAQLSYRLGEVNNLHSLLAASDPGRPETTDLLVGVSRAIDVLDPLIPPSLRLSVDARRSALLAIGRADFVRMLAHILLHATDFTGHLGEVSLRSVLDLTRPRGEQTPTDLTAEIVVLGERRNDLSHAADMRDRYLLRRAQRAQPRITVRDEEPTIKQLRTGEKLLSGTPLAKNTESAAAANTSLPAELESLDLDIARNIAARFDVQIQVTRPEKGLLAIYLGLPLAGSL